MSSPCEKYCKAKRLNNQIKIWLDDLQDLEQEAFEILQCLNTLREKVACAKRESDKLQREFWYEAGLVDYGKEERKNKKSKSNSWDSIITSSQLTEEELMKLIEEVEA